MTFLAAINPLRNLGYPIYTMPWRLTAAGAVFGWMTLITYLLCFPAGELTSSSHIQSETYPFLGNVRSIMAHLVMFGVMAVLLQMNARSWIGDSAFQIRWLVAIACLATLYGIAMECYQMSIPSRSPSLEDLVANGTGVLMTLAALRIWAPIRGAGS